MESLSSKNLGKKGNHPTFFSKMSGGNALRRKLGVLLGINYSTRQDLFDQEGEECTHIYISIKEKFCRKRPSSEIKTARSGYLVGLEGASKNGGRKSSAGGGGK